MSILPVSDSGKRAAYAIILSAVVFLLGLCNLDNNCNWGDDYAAYLTDGIAIVEGKYDEQIHINTFLRFGSREGDTVHVHAIGMPLLHALVYSLCGFDRCGFDNLYVYKLPSLIFLSAMCGVYYLFLCRRIDRRLSVGLALVLCCSGSFSYAIRNLGNDVIYMSLTVMCFYEAELFSDGIEKKRLHGIILGCLLWFAVCIRLNGVSVAIAVLIFQIAAMFRRKRRLDSSDLVPYIVVAVLYLVINRAVFPTPTSTSSLSDITLKKLVKGTSYYAMQLYAFFYTLTGNILIAPIQFALRIITPGKNPITLYAWLNSAFTYLLFVLMLLGLAAKGFRENVVISIYAAANFLITAGLCLGQELRYLYTILPILIMYLGYGVFFIHEMFVRKKKLTGKASTVIRCAGSTLLCALTALPLIRSGVENIKNPHRELLTAYSDYAVETYNYIENNVSADSTIAFFKPRALYLNTGVLSFLPGKGGMTASDGDYYLYYKPDPGFLLPDESGYEPVFENAEFKLLEKVH